MSGKCKNCNVYLRKTSGYKKIIKSEEEAEVFSRCMNKEILVNDVLCNKCRLIKYRTQVTNASAVVTNPQEADERPTCEEPGELHMCLEDTGSSDDSDFTCEYRQREDYVEMPFQRVVSTHKYCIICNKTDNLHRISFETRVEVFAKKQIFIPKGDRCCNIHLIGKSFYEDDLSRLNIVSNISEVEKTEIANFLNLLSNKSQKSLFESIKDFDMSENQVITLTGLSWDNIIDLKRLLTSMRDTRRRSVTQALIIFLFKLRTGNSNKIIASIFGIQYEQYISEFFKEIIKGFEKNILPYYFGYSAVCREELILNTTDVTKKLLNVRENQLVLIVDGTYVRHQKSKNNYYQRKSYSSQKKTNLCKPFTICTTNGFVVDFAGPFYGSQNDASIMKMILEDPSGINRLLLPNDIFIVDRGFRDVVGILNEKGFNVLMPAFKGNKPQLTTEEANMSRKITKIRWVVEAVHGVIAQKYRLLHHCVDNKMLPRIGLLCKIVGFLHNKYDKRLGSDRELSENIIQYMESRINLANTLSQEVLDQKWNRKKSTLQQLKACELLDFPRLTEEQLKIFFTGSYQFSLAVSYLAELMDDDNNLSIHYVKATPNVVKAQVKSRHINSKVYRIYIDYTPNGTDYNSICRYCCECPNGNRTVGCCSHVAALIYYLSYGRYLSRIVHPAAVLPRIFEIEQVPVVNNENSDDD